MTEQVKKAHRQNTVQGPFLMQLIKEQIPCSIFLSNIKLSAIIKDFDDHFIYVLAKGKEIEIPVYKHDVSVIKPLRDFDEKPAPAVLAPPKRKKR